MYEISSIDNHWTAVQDVVSVTTSGTYYHYPWLCFKNGLDEHPLTHPVRRCHGGLISPWFSAGTEFILVLCLSSLLSFSWVYFSPGEVETSRQAPGPERGTFVKWRDCLWHWQCSRTKMWRTISLLNVHWHSESTLYSKATKITLHCVPGVTFY